MRIERDQRHGRDGAEELDDRPQAAVHELVGADEQPERDRDHGRDREAERPATVQKLDSPSCSKSVRNVVVIGGK